MKKIKYLVLIAFIFALNMTISNAEYTVGKIEEQNACTEVTNNIVYYNASLFDYNYNGFNSAARNMSYAQYNNLSTEQKQALDSRLALTGPNSTDVRNALYQGLGLAQNKLDANGNVVNKNTNYNGVTFFPTPSEVTRLNNLGFGTVYNQALFDVKFPFKKLSNGYTRFYSSEAHVKYNASTRTFMYHEGQAGGNSGAGTQQLGLWPFNSACWLQGATSFGNNVLHYGMKLTIPFYMTADGKTVNFDTRQREDMLFNFAGDDDVWVFVDDTLILDIGGEHGEQTGWINFATNTTYTQIGDKTTTNAFGASRLAEGFHNLTIFYMERPGGGSNFKAQFNLPDVVNVTGTKVWADNNNQYNLRPGSYTLSLYANGTKVDTKTFTSTNWAFNNVPKYTDQGALITYTVREDRITLSNQDYYEPSINGTTVTNTLVRIPRDLKVNYIDQITGDVLSSEDFTGYVGQVKATAAKNITDYTCVSTEKSKDVTYTVAPQTVNYYYKHNAKVIVKYVDENAFDGSVLGTDEITGLEKDAFKTTAKTFDGYRLTSTPDNTQGEMDRNTIVVTYGYKKISAGVDIEYVDDVTGEKLTDTIHKDGLELDPYTSEEKTFDGYELEVRPGNRTGAMEVELTTVTYRYRKLSTVTAQYVDDNYGTKITEDVSKKYKEGYNYITEEKIFDGYKLTSKTDNFVGVMRREDITVRYGYKKISAGVDVKFVDDVTGAELTTGLHLDGLEKDSYTTEAKEITGYELEVTPENKNGEMTVDLTTVTYRYRKVSNVVTSFIDVNTNTYISDDVTKGYKEGYDYTTAPKTLTGYVLTQTPENANGTMNRNNIYVTYGYKKVSSGVDIKYLDDVTGEELVTTIHLDGNEKDEYTSNSKVIPGYELEVKPSNPNGIMTVDPITVEYRYRKVSSVTAKYVDLNGNKAITDDVTKNYKEGYDYTTEQKVFDGYVLITAPENKAGTMGRENVTVTYEYKKIAGGVEIKYIDDVTNQNLETPTVLNGNEKDEYTSSVKTFGGYALEKTATNPNGLMTVEKINVTYTYRKLSTVTTKFVDMISGEEITDAVNVSVKQGYDFKTEPKALTGYVLMENSGNTQGTMQRENVEVTYYYKKISDGIVVNYVDLATNDLLDSKSYTGNEGDMITLEKLAISGYTFDSTDAPEEMEAALTVDPQVFTFYYRKAVGVTVIHKDVTNNKVLDTETLNGEEGKYYNAMAKEYDGYVLLNATTAITGVFSRDTNTVVFEYKQLSPGVTIKYVDEEGNVMDQDKISGFVGDKYTTVDKEYEKYNFVEVEGEKEGLLKAEPIEVTYKYEKKKSHVYVTYVDEFGQTILEEEFEDKVDSEYKVEPTAIENYRIKELPENIEGTYGLEDTYVTIKMERIPGKIILKLLDEEGNVIGEFAVDGFVGDEPEVFEIPDIEGYIKGSDDTLKVDYVEGELVVKVIYEKIPDTGDINVLALGFTVIVSALGIRKIVLKKRVE